MSKAIIVGGRREEDTTCGHVIRASKPWSEPLTVSVSEACRVSGMSVRELYRRLSAKQIRAVKLGTRTLIRMDSLRQYIASLPRRHSRKEPPQNKEQPRAASPGGAAAGKIAV
jgi:excisionase family DNA binding protein